MYVDGVQIFVEKTKLILGTGELNKKCFFIF